MIVYVIKSTLCLIVLLGVYHLFLEREKMHRFNRYFLLFGLIFSLTIPLLIIELPAPAISNAQLSNQLNRLTDSQSYQAPTLPEPTDHTLASENQPEFPIIPYLFIGYVLISGVLFIRLLQNLYSLGMKAYRNESIPFKNAALVLVPGGKVPHSFFGYIFVNEQMYRNGTIDEAVFIHELTHVRQKHSLDILFIELLKVIFWFNPAIYFYKKAMQLNHEFLADQTVVSGAQNVSVYQRLLLKIQSNEKDIQLTSSIQYSITKKRIMMMTKTSTRLRTVCKQLALVPLLAALLFTFSTRTTAAQDVSTMSPAELMEVVHKKLESADTLTPKEKEELNSLLLKIQRKLMPKPPAPEKPSAPQNDNKDRYQLYRQGFTFKAPPPSSKEDSMAIAKLNKEYNAVFKKYNEILPTQENYEILETTFDSARELIDKYADLYREIYLKYEKNPPPPPPTIIPKSPKERREDYFFKKDLPPPPKPLSPTERIKRNSEKSPPQPPVKADTTNLNQISKEYSRLINAYLEIQPVRKNETMMGMTYKPLIDLYDNWNKIFEKNEHTYKLAPPPMSPTSRMLAYYRQHPELAKENVPILKIALKDHRRMLEKYKNTPLTEENRVELGIMYAQIKTNYKNWNYILQESGTGMELPPLPEAAWKRLKEHAN